MGSPFLPKFDKWSFMRLTENAVILSERSESKDLRTPKAAKQKRSCVDPSTPLRSARDDKSGGNLEREASICNIARE